MAVHFELDPPVVVVTLDRPKANAFDQEQLDALERTFERVASSSDARAVVVRGASDVAFSAGADLGALGPLAEPEGLSRWTEQAHRLLDRIAELPIPVIAALRKPAVGGGFELALACHFRVLARDTHVALPEVGRGYLPSWGGFERVARAASLAFALDMIATGRRVGADEALQRGLVHRVAEDAEATALELARELAALPPLAVSAAIAQCDRIARGAGRAEIRAAELADLERLGRSEDTVEGVLAFFEKRKATFKGR